MADWGKIDKIRERMAVLERGELKRMYRIEATTAKGVGFTVDVRYEDMTKAKIQEVLSAKAAELDEILEL
jgi:hypothetical protein